MTPQIYLIKALAPLQHHQREIFWRCVTPEKRERILRQRVQQNADNILLGDVLVKVVIKETFHIPISEQRFGYGEYGKPYLLGYPEIQFNISHSNQYIVCGICDRPIGVDIQKTGTYKQTVAERVCSQAELQKILESKDRDSKFIKIWSAKEAILKAYGHGIGSVSLREVDSSSAKSLRVGQYWFSYVVI